MSAIGNVRLERVSGALQSGGRPAEFGGIFSRISIFQFSEFSKMIIWCIYVPFWAPGGAL